MSPYAKFAALPIEKRADGSRRVRRIAHPKPGHLSEPVLVLREDDLPSRSIADGPAQVWAVRLTHDVRLGDGNYMGQPLTHVSDVYLDGRWVKDTYGDGRIVKHEEDTDMAAVSAARTNDIVDFGRFTGACNALVRAVDAAGAEPTAEQEESILRSYQNLLVWREDLTRRVLEMDGALDIAAAKVRQALR